MVVAGAELITGNILVAMACASPLVTPWEVVRSWANWAIYLRKGADASGRRANRRSDRDGNAIRIHPTFRNVSAPEKSAPKYQTAHHTR